MDAPLFTRSRIVSDSLMSRAERAEFLRVLRKELREKPASDIPRDTPAKDEADGGEFKPK